MKTPSRGTSHSVMSNETSRSQIAPYEKFESNPDIAKPKLSSLRNFSMRNHEEAVHSSLKNVEVTCAADFATMCAGAADIERPVIDQLSFAFSSRKIVIDIQSISRSEADVSKHTVSNRKSVNIKRRWEQEGNALQIDKEYFFYLQRN